MFVHDDRVQALIDLFWERSRRRRVQNEAAAEFLTQASSRFDSPISYFELRYNDVRVHKRNTRCGNHRRIDRFIR